MSLLDAPLSDSFQDVPGAERDVPIDPHWSRLRAGSTLPAVYMPPSMAGDRSRWLRIVAVTLVTMFVFATGAGVCLTYGPQPFGH